MDTPFDWTQFTERDHLTGDDARLPLAVRQLLHHPMLYDLIGDAVDEVEQRIMHQWISLDRCEFNGILGQLLAHKMGQEVGMCIATVIDKADVTREEVTAARQGMLAAFIAGVDKSLCNWFYAEAPEHITTMVVEQYKARDTVEEIRKEWW